MYSKQDLSSSFANWPRLEQAYTILVALFCVILVITNLGGLKIFQAPFSTLPLTTGILTYPLTFVLSDLVTEIYGRKRANFMVYLGFGVSLLMFAIIQLILAVPPHPYWMIEGNPFAFSTTEEYQRAFEATFSVTGTLIFASMLAYMTAQLIDVFLFQKIKEYTKGRHLWLRNNLSTMASQLVDTLIVSSIVLFGGLHMEFAKGAELIASTYVYKLALTLLSTPLVYLLVRMLRKGKRASLATPDRPAEAVE